MMWFRVRGGVLGKKEEDERVCCRGLMRSGTRCRGRKSRKRRRWRGEEKDEEEGEGVRERGGVGAGGKMD